MSVSTTGAQLLASLREQARLKEQLTRAAEVNRYDLDVLRLFRTSLGPELYSPGQLEKSLERIQACIHAGVRAIDMEEL